MAGTTINPYRFGGQLGYRRDGPNRLYIRERYLDTSRSRWLSRDPVPIAAADFNFYWYAKNNPLTFTDPSGNLPISPPGPHPCEQRTLQYCKAAVKYGNHAEACFCNVSAVLCQFFIKNKSINYRQRVFVDCLNKCMYQHWLNRNTPKWIYATKQCQCKPATPSEDCCRIFISAEQDGLTQCLSKCGPVSWPPGLTSGLGSLLDFPFNGPEAQRVAAGQKLCCSGDQTGNMGTGDFPSPWDTARNGVMSQR